MIKESTSEYTLLQWFPQHPVLEWIGDDLVKMTYFLTHEELPSDMTFVLKDSAYHFYDKNERKVWAMGFDKARLIFLKDNKNGK